MRTELGELSPVSAEALENVQSILEHAVDSVRLLSYALCPANAAKCGLRDFVRMTARAFDVQVPDFDQVPPASPAAAVELAAQLLDCLLLSSPNGHTSTRVLFSFRNVSIDAPATAGGVCDSIIKRPLRHWTASFQAHPRRKRVTISWDLASLQE